VHANGSGWNTKATLKEITECMIKEIEDKRAISHLDVKPALFLCDSHSSRASPELWRELAKHNIDLLTLPAHTSHLLQPLDRGVNGAFKKILKQLWDHPKTRSIADYRRGLVSCLPEAISRSFSPNLINHAWRVTGISPFQPKRVLVGLPIELEGTVEFFEKTESRGFRIDSKLLTAPEMLSAGGEDEADTEDAVQPEAIVDIDLDKVDENGLHKQKRRKLKVSHDDYSDDTMMERDEEPDEVSSEEDEKKVKELSQRFRMKIDPKKHSGE
jgi:hypothetical protein